MTARNRKRTIDDRTRSRLDTLANRLIVAASTLKLGAAGGEGEGVDEQAAHALHLMIDSVAANLLDMCREAEEAARGEAVVPPAMAIDTGIFDLENDRDDLVKAMGQLTAARHDIMGAFTDDSALDEVFRLLANVKAGLENAHGALVDAGVFVQAKKAG